MMSKDRLRRQMKIIILYVVAMALIPLFYLFMGYYGPSPYNIVGPGDWVYFLFASSVISVVGFTGSYLYYKQTERIIR